MGRRCIKRGEDGRRTGTCEHGFVDLVRFGTGRVCQCEKFKKAPVIKQDKTISALSRKVATLNKALREGKDVDPWKRVEGWHGWEQEMLGGLLGAMPVMDVRLVPEGELVRYACRDSDATLRISRFLDKYKVL